MKKWLIIALALCLVAFAACGREETAEEPVQVSVPPMEEHEVRLVETVQDFKITVTSLQASYDRSLFDGDIPLQGGVQIQYCGPQDELTISHSIPAYGIGLYQEHYHLMPLNVSLDSGYVTVLSKEQIYEDTWWAVGSAAWSGERPMLSALPAGEYTIHIEVNFHYCPSGTEVREKFVHEMQLPVTLY